MAHVQVFCGITAAETDSWLAVAVVDDAGRILDARHVSDDPNGYALLTAILLDKSAAVCPVAVDSHGYLMTQLIAASGRPMCVVDPATVTDITERFCPPDTYEEARLPIAHRRAAGLARAILAGVVYAAPQRSTWDLDEVKPILAAHGAVATGRQNASLALRHVLAELYPAALRAFADPADHVALRILDALPEPSMLAMSPASRHHDAALISDMVATGIADTTTAVSALNALRMAAQDPPRWNSHQRFAPMIAETVRQSVAAVRSADCARAALVGALVERLSATNAHSIANPRPYLSPAVPISPAPRTGVGAAIPASVGAHGPNGAAVNGTAMNGSGANGAGPMGLARPPHQRTAPAPTHQPPYAAAAHTPPAPAAFAGSSTAFATPPAAFATPPAAFATPPAPFAMPPAQSRFHADPLTAPLDRPISPAQTSPAWPQTEPPGHTSGAPTAGDNDLLIFSEAQSAWFTSPEEARNALNEETANWSQLADDGWRSAEHAASPLINAHTITGLPKRVPQANLVPGSVPQPRRAPRIVRDAQRIATNTAGYFRGWRRGQEIGGFAVGQRDRGGWEFNRDQRDHAFAGADSRTRSA